MISIISGLAPPKIVVLGTGGVGKTSLVHAVLHHPTVTQKYLPASSNHTGSRIIFISCERATNITDLVVLVALGLNLLGQSTQIKLLVIHELSNRAGSSPGCLLVLDNLETCWEPTRERSAVEAFLTQLDTIEGLGLIVCHPSHI
jgi:hypothetical protein